MTEIRYFFIHELLDNGINEYKSSISLLIELKGEKGMLFKLSFKEIINFELSIDSWFILKIIAYLFLVNMQ